MLHKTNNKPIVKRPICLELFVQCASVKGAVLFESWGHNQFEFYVCRIMPCTEIA